jgi:hypothetical protein
LRRVHPGSLLHVDGEADPSRGCAGPNEAAVYVRAGRGYLGRTFEYPDKEDKPVGIGISLFLVAVGAILAFAVDATVSGLDIVTVGWILMGVGALGLVLSLVFWSSWGGFTTTTRRDTIVERDRTAL